MSPLSHSPTSRPSRSKNLGLRAARYDQEPVAAGRPRKRVHGVAVTRCDLSERLQVALHAVEVVHAHGVVVRAGEQARAGVLQRERAYDFAVALHLRLVGHRQALVAVVLGIPAARVVVVLVLVGGGFARRATRVRGGVGGRRGGGPRRALRGSRRALRRAFARRTRSRSRRVLAPAETAGEHRAQRRVFIFRRRSRDFRRRRPLARAFRGLRRVAFFVEERGRTRRLRDPPLPVQELLHASTAARVHSSGDAAHRAQLRRLLVVRVAHLGDAGAVAGASTYERRGGADRSRCRNANPTSWKIMPGIKSHRRHCGGRARRCRSRPPRSDARGAWVSRPWCDRTTRVFRVSRTAHDHAGRA
jgi:hypothetical protein